MAIVEDLTLWGPSPVVSDLFRGGVGKALPETLPGGFPSGRDGRVAVVPFNFTLSIVGDSVACSYWMGGGISATVTLSSVIVLSCSSAGVARDVVGERKLLAFASSSLELVLMSLRPVLAPFGSTGLGALAITSE